ncbi:MAG: guanylate kinase, partial [Desulfuromonas sp.]
DVLLDIDCQGAAQLKKNLGNGVFIFILPPNLDELEKRLVDRKTDSADVVNKRIENARKEIPEARWYDYIVVNDNFDFALLELKAILMAETCRTRVALSPLQDVFEF